MAIPGAHAVDLRPGSVDPAVLMTRAVQAAEPAYGAKGVALQARVDRGLLTVSVDPDRLGEVLANLVATVLRHTPSGGWSRSPPWDAVMRSRWR